jgi:hypothetical protein
MWESTDTSLRKVAALSDPSACRPQLIEVSLDRVAQYGVILKPKAGSVFLTQNQHWSREKRVSFSLGYQLPPVILFFFLIPLP